jgi:N-acetylglucosamine kinase-like BadF-type ATPase
MAQYKQTTGREYFLGFDGGGTKTDCILMDSAGTVLAHATAGPSNPLRAGYARAWFTLSDAADVVLAHQQIKAGDIGGICAGIGGAAREAVAKRIATFLEHSFPGATIEVTTDLAITLHAAVGEGEGVIVIVGTGSAAYGRNSDGMTARSGGRGPWFSDEGSGFDIGRRALSAVVRAEEHRGPKTKLVERVLQWLGCRDWERVLDWVIKNPDDVFPRIFPLVAELADQGDAVSREILGTAAESLADLTAAVVEKLKMRDRALAIFKSGGTVGRSKFFDAAMDAALSQGIPGARVSVLDVKPAETAARLATRLAGRSTHAN